MAKFYEKGGAMARYINNMDELQAALMPEMKKMVDGLAERVYETLNFFLQEYYNSYDPTSYQRQYDFLHSAVKVDSRIRGNKVEAYVYIDYNSMNNYRKVSGLQVVTWANEGLHGGLDVGNNTPYVWDETMEYTVNNGKLLSLAVEYLKSKGFNVKK